MLLSHFHVFLFCFFFFFFNDPAPTEIYTLSLHDALPICSRSSPLSTAACMNLPQLKLSRPGTCSRALDRKSTRLNSSHTVISYAVFCLKKKKNLLHSLTTLPRRHPERRIRESPTPELNTA